MWALSSFYYAVIVTYLRCTVLARTAKYHDSSRTLDIAVFNGTSFYHYANTEAMYSAERPFRNVDSTDGDMPPASFLAANRKVHDILQDILRNASERHSATYVQRKAHLESTAGMAAGLIEADAAVHKNRSMSRERLEQLVSDFYASGMDVEAKQAAGTSIFNPLLEQISHISDTKSLAQNIAALHSVNIQAVFRVDIFPGLDLQRSNMFLLKKTPLGLQTLDDYLAKNRFSERAEYKQRISRKLCMLGDRNSEAPAEEVIEFETELARSPLNFTLNRPTFVGVEDLRALSAPFDLPAHFKAIGSPHSGLILAESVDLLQTAGRLTGDTHMSRWHSYLRWCLLDRALPILIGDTAHNMTARADEVLAKTNDVLGDALGQLYVQAAFTPSQKARATQSVRTLQAALRESVIASEWMTSQTRQGVLDKLDHLSIHVGEPQTSVDYTDLVIDRSSYADNIMRARRHSFADKVATIGQPGRAYLQPQVVNALYSNCDNSIHISAAIMQSPLFDAHADYAVLYGGIDAIIGHEICTRMVRTSGDHSPCLDLRASGSLAKI